jgi:hypothetical protein
VGEAQVFVAVDECFVEVEDQRVLDCMARVVHLEGSSVTECFSIYFCDGLRLFCRYLSV